MTTNFSSLAVLLALATVILLGCDSTTTTTPRAFQPTLDDTEVLQQDDLTLGMEMLHRIHELNTFAVDDLAMYHLNQWLVRQTDKTEGWKRSELLNYLYGPLREIQPVKDLERLRLSREDLDFLHGRILQRDLGLWLNEKPLAEPWGTWLTAESKLDKQQSAQLGTALRLFDWTIRNIQLEPLAEAETSKQQGTSTASDVLPPQRGEPGPGYQRYAYETLLYGRGDAWERMKLFIELCRQQQIEAVVLATTSEEGGTRPWTVGVLIGQEVYLFDTELGLPISGPDRKGVATLKQLLSEPELLRQLDVDDERKYWLDAEDLKTLKPLICASPEELSLRMWLLDERVTGPKHLELFVDADALAKRLNEIPELTGTKPSLWRVPFETWLYVSLGRNLQLSRNADLAREYELLTGAIRSPFSPVRKGRQKQIQGIFETSEDSQARVREQAKKGQVDPFNPEAGAVELFLASRPEGRAVEELAYSDFYQRMYGLSEQLSKNPEEKRQQLEFFTARIQRMRNDVSYWLGLVQYEKEDYANAAKWLQDSLSDEDDKAPWAAGARYNLARCHEAQGKWDEAAKLYREDDSPQEYGNALRAKWNAERANTQSD